MKIAATYENGMIFQHFGRTEQFKLYRAENGIIKSAVVVDTEGVGHGALADFLRAWDVEALICGGIGLGALTALTEAGIAVYPGVDGSADEAAKALAEGRLAYDPDALCDHHEHEHGEGHECHHRHGCGEHGCR